jgi:arabinofuranosyltransferase
VLLLGWQAWARRWIVDDGFIYLRVVKMIEAGHGPVFNIGERVEITSSVLWTWLLVLADLVLPLRLEWIAVLLGLVLTVTGLALAMAASSMLWRAVRRSEAAPNATILVPAGALVMAVVPPVWDYATSGMEGGLVFGWLGAVMWVLARWAVRADTGATNRSSRLGIGAAMLLGLGPLIRPDVALVSVVVIVGVVAAQWRNGWADRVRTVAAAAALPVAYQVFRMGYYAALVPNTALAKSAGRPRWRVGWFYLSDFARTYWLAVPLVLLLLIGWPLARRARARGLATMVAVVALPVAGVLQTLYVVRVGGDYLHARLLLPAFWSMLAPVAVAPLALRRMVLRRNRHELGRVVAVGAVTVWAVTCGVSLRHPYLRYGAGVVIVNAPHGAPLTNGRNVASHPVLVSQQGLRSPPFDESAPVTAQGRPLPVVLPKGLRVPTAALYGVGTIGYLLGPRFYVLDMLGLGDPLNARLTVNTPREPGHEKVMPLAWLVARVSNAPIAPNLLPNPGSFVGWLYTSPPGSLEKDVALARETLRCRPVRELLDAVRAPLTPGRFITNMVESFRLTRLQIPPDPQRARESLCK